MVDQTLEVAVRRARMAAAVADAPQTASATIAGLAAGAGAELVARAQFSRDALASRLRRRGDPRSLRLASSLEADLGEGSPT